MHIKGLNPWVFQLESPVNSANQTDETRTL